MPLLGSHRASIGRDNHNLTCDHKLPYKAVCTAAALELSIILSESACRSCSARARSRASQSVLLCAVWSIKATIVCLIDLLGTVDRLLENGLQLHGVFASDW